MTNRAKFLATTLGGGAALLGTGASAGLVTRPRRLLRCPQFHNHTLGGCNGPPPFNVDTTKLAKTVSSNNYTGGVLHQLTPTNASIPTADSVSQTSTVQTGTGTALVRATGYGASTITMGLLTTAMNGQPFVVNGTTFTVALTSTTAVVKWSNPTHTSGIGWYNPTVKGFSFNVSVDRARTYSYTNGRVQNMGGFFGGVATILAVIGAALLFVGMFTGITEALVVVDGILTIVPYAAAYTIGGFGVAVGGGIAAAMDNAGLEPAWQTPYNQLPCCGPCYIPPIGGTPGDPGGYGGGGSQDDGFLVQ